VGILSASTAPPRPGHRSIRPAPALIGIGFAEILRDAHIACAPRLQAGGIQPELFEAQSYGAAVHGRSTARTAQVRRNPAPERKARSAGTSRIGHHLEETTTTAADLTQRRAAALLG
jgi:hypothetical protein